MTSVSPTTSSPPRPSSSLEPSSSSEPPPTDALRAMRLDREERTEATSTRDDTSNLCIDDTLANELKLIIEKIQSFPIRNEQRQIDAAINELQAIINVALTMHIGQIQTPIETFKVKYKLNLPLNTYEEFIELDNKIREDECGTFFKLMLSKQFDNEKTLYINIKAILKQYITKNVALLFTAQKEVRDQRVFKDTNFSKCLLSVINEKKGILDKDYLKALGDVLSSAKSWDPPRARPSEQN
ncbi:unnamed protein product [Lasius platythorax]|uniref:Uncharacterized protein n=1 Tax=Lasius platythorax TaxID=488582 RepID=A0AAV2NFK5_9HYME